MQHPDLVFMVEKSMRGDRLPPRHAAYRRPITELRSVTGRVLVALGERISPTQRVSLDRRPMVTAGPSLAPCT